MLKTGLLHPEILSALGESGHGSKVLIADGNYAFLTKVGKSTKIVYLNLAPDNVTVTEVLQALLTVINVESADVMMPESGEEPSIFAEFRELLPEHELNKHERFAFYDEAMDDHVTLMIATGDTRLYANLLLTLDCV